MAGRRHLPPFHPGVLGWVVVVDEAGGDPARPEALQDIELAVRLRAEELFQRLGERPQGDPAAPIIRRLRQCTPLPASGLRTPALTDIERPSPVGLLRNAIERIAPDCEEPPALGSAPDPRGADESLRGRAGGVFDPPGPETQSPGGDSGTAPTEGLQCRGVRPWGSNQGSCERVGSEVRIPTE